MFYDLKHEHLLSKLDKYSITYWATKCVVKNNVKSICGFWWGKTLNLHELISHHVKITTPLYLVVFAKGHANHTIEVGEFL